MFVEADVRQALNTVMDPELRRSIVELDMVRNLQVSGKRVSFVLALTTLACPLREKIAEEARAAIAGLDGDVEVSIELSERRLSAPSSWSPCRDRRRGKNSSPLPRT